MNGARTSMRLRRSQTVVFSQDSRQLGRYVGDSMCRNFSVSSNNGAARLYTGPCRVNPFPNFIGARGHPASRVHDNIAPSNTDDVIGAYAAGTPADASNAMSATPLPQPSSPTVKTAYTSAGGAYG